MAKTRKEREEYKIVVGGEKSLAFGYDRLKDNMLYINADGKKKVIQVESSIQHEGKTTIACNLAVCLGKTNKKVIVLDLDFRRPRVHRTFDRSVDDGLAEYILGNLTLEQIIKPTDYENVEIITRGARVYNSSLVFLSDKFKDLVAELKEKYDFVILDCPPVLQVSDYIHISKVADGVLFVVAYGQTTKSQASEAIKEIKKNGTEVLGSVFSMCDKGGEDHYAYGYKYGYKYGYGYKDDSEENK